MKLFNRNDQKPSRKNARTNQAMWMIFLLALASMIPDVTTTVLAVAIPALAACAGAYVYVEGRNDRASIDANRDDPTLYPNPGRLNHD